MAKKSKLPVQRPGEVVASGPSPKMDKQYEERERRYRAEEALRTLSKADEHRKDKELMRDVKMLAKSQMKACGK